MRSILYFLPALFATIPFSCGRGSRGAEGASAALTTWGAEVCGNARDDDHDGLVDDADLDGDGFIDLRCALEQSPLPGGDCDDADPTVHPGAAETLDGQDEDCDGLTDEGTDAWDRDGDCVCVAAACTGTENPFCQELAGGDCDDADRANFPGNAEVCDDADNDCDGEIDQGLPFLSWWPDADGDGFGAQAAAPVTTCHPAPAGTVGNNGDCDDAYQQVSPLLREIECDGLDNDCDADTEDGEDDDGDGVTACFDCDDDDPRNSPDNEEVCDGRDNDCTGEADDGLEFDDWWPDNDGDGYGDEHGREIEACSPVPGRVSNDDDCDDGRFWVHPGAFELPCDGVDNDCGGGDAC